MVRPTRTGAQHPQHLGSSISASFRWPAWHTWGGIRCDAGPNRGVRGPGGRHDCVWFCLLMVRLRNRCTLGKQVSGRRAFVLHRTYFK